jgi:hypothetical protein
LFEHDLFGKPVATFPDHALANKREAERRQAHWSILRAFPLFPPRIGVPAARARRGCSSGESREGARRALKRSALACRRSTTALAAANERHRSTPATRFLGLGRGARSRWFERSCTSQRALPAPSCPSPASFLADRSSCRPGVFPKPPGAQS